MTPRIPARISECHFLSAVEAIAFRHNGDAPIGNRELAACIGLAMEPNCLPRGNVHPLIHNAALQLGAGTDANSIKQDAIVDLGPIFDDYAC